MSQLHLYGPFVELKGDIIRINGPLTSQSEITNSARNLFMGNTSGAVITTGIRNTLFGSISGPLISAGSLNSFFGDFTGPLVTSGNGNCFFGQACAPVATTCSDCTVLGQNGGPTLTTGNGNVFIGRGAGTNVTTGAFNIIIGHNQGAPSNTTGCTFIGSSGNTTSCYLLGVSGVSQTGPTAAVTVNASGQLGITAPSRREDKENIVAMDKEANHQKLMAVLPRDYVYKNWDPQVLQHGVIIDEVVNSFPEIIGYHNGEARWVSLEQLIVPIIADLQLLWEKFDETHPVVMQQ